MYKRGFTLSEILITLSIVGIVAAVTVPSLVAFLPSQQKMKYLKAHNTLLQAIEELSSDSGLYYPQYNNNGQLNCTGNSNGLKCTGAPLDGHNANAAGTEKLGRLLAEKMHLSSGVAVVNNADNSVVTFTSSDNVRWSVTDTDDANPATITIDVDPNNADNSYCRGTFSNNCQKPDQFTFSVASSGVVSPQDALGQAFIAASSKLSNSQVKQDVANAKLILKNSSSSSNDNINNDKDNVDNNDQVNSDPTVAPGEEEAAPSPTESGTDPNVTDAYTEPNPST